MIPRPRRFVKILFFLAAAHWRLGLVLKKQGHKDQAEQEIQQAVTLDPDFDSAKKGPEKIAMSCS